MKTENAKVVVFTDLDGSLLDEDYSLGSAKAIIDKLSRLGASVVFCTSKTREEVEFYRREMGVSDPFIVENGGAIHIPKGYFSFEFESSRKTRQYDVLTLGQPYSVVRKKLAGVNVASDVRISGFGDMTDEEVATDSGLSLNMARLAKKREYDEPFRLLSGNEKAVLMAIELEGLTWTKGGKYFHALGDTDKGKATMLLKEMYVREFGDVSSFGVGDSAADLKMLEAVDVPFLIRNGFGGVNSHLVVWQNLLRIACEKISSDFRVRFLLEPLST